MTLENAMESTEESLIEELRRRFSGNHLTQEQYQDDNMFMRFLRARNHDLDAAETMLRNHLNWRKQNKVDNMLTDYTPHEFMLTEYIPLNPLGDDLDGNPVSYIHLGGLDPKGILKSVPRNDIYMYITYYLERDMAAMRKRTTMTGKLIDKCTYIFNFEGFSLTCATHKTTLETLAAIVSLYEKNYPERLKTAYVINASYYFTLFWMFIRQFVAPATAKKMKIFGKTGWQEALLQDISPEVVPAFLGGKRTDPDGNPLCKTFTRFGGPVPEKYFKISANQLFSSRLPGGKKLHIQRMSRAEVTSSVVYPGSSLEWEFVVKSRDIGVCVFLVDGCGNREVVVPKERFEASDFTESGMFQCEKAGTYVIEFDNTYSWMHSKEVYCTVTVVPPKQSGDSDETLFVEN